MQKTIALESVLLTELGQRIKRLRMARGLNQAHFSIICDMEKSSMSKIESGQVNITYLTLWRLSKCLEISMKELCGN